MKVFKSINKNLNSSDGYKHTLGVHLNEHDNGGEAVYLRADVYENEDKENYHNIHLETTCYGTSRAKLSLFGIDLESIKEGIDSILGEIKS